jgi:hypothetical protein
VAALGWLPPGHSSAVSRDLLRQQHGPVFSQCLDACVAQEDEPTVN